MMEKSKHNRRCRPRLRLHQTRRPALSISVPSPRGVDQCKSRRSDSVLYVKALQAVNSVLLAHTLYNDKGRRRSQKQEK